MAKRPPMMQHPIGSPEQMARQAHMNSSGTATKGSRSSAHHLTKVKKTGGKSKRFLVGGNPPNGTAIGY